MDVQVIVPQGGRLEARHVASHTYCESLRKAGIKVFEYGPPMLHAKTMVVDDTVAIVGTANLDNRSFRLNFEVAAAFYDKHDHRAPRRALRGGPRGTASPSRAGAGEREGQPAARVDRAADFAGALTRPRITSRAVAAGEKLHGSGGGGSGRYGFGYAATETLPSRS